MIRLDLNAQQFSSEPLRVQEERKWLTPTVCPSYYHCPRMKGCSCHVQREGWPLVRGHRGGRWGAGTCHHSPNAYSAVYRGNLLWYYVCNLKRSLGKTKQWCALYTFILSLLSTLLALSGLEWNVLLSTSPCPLSQMYIQDSSGDAGTSFMRRVTVSVRNCLRSLSQVGAPLPLAILREGLFVAQASIKLTSLLSQPSKCWDY